MCFKNRFSLIAIVFAVSITGCKKWDDHIAVTDQDLTKDLATVIAADNNLSKFREYVTKAGMDSLLRSSKTYTVWAPTDAALAGLDPAIVNDVEKLRAFIRNHIANQSFFTREMAAGAKRIPMLNGKYNLFSTTKFEDATITSADRYVKNGVLHIIDKNIPVLPSVWDFITTTTSQYAQNAFIAGLDFNAFDPTLAIIDSISATTGLPIYRPGTGIVVRNRFNDRVYNLKDESKQYTYFVMANASFTKEADSLKPFFATAIPNSTDSLAKWNTVRDLAVEGLYPATAFAGLISKYGTPIPANAALLVETRKVSNGIVHIFSNVDVVTVSKFRQSVIQGESPSGFLSDKSGNTNYRVRLNTLTNTNFTDIMVTGHGVTTYYSFYRLNEMPSLKYRVFGFAVNDFQAAAFAQTIVAKSFVAPSTYTTLASLNYNVPLNSAAGAYGEVLLGEFTATSYGTLEIQLTSTATNPIVLDYLRLVPLP